ncbi:hypothetical protein DW150_15305 [Phocaeicola vulgatus]|uniref:Uncharacterized protein n=1 Tax=Phocaeicola vulgatus TaxID=821 RepID=A0A415BPD2_PHOVU|nr:hypothetical protein DW150_15305 [Phocaeicola vulgatus]
MFLDYSKNKQETDYRYTYLDANSSGRIIAQMVRYIRYSKQGYLVLGTRLPCLHHMLARFLV